MDQKQNQITKMLKRKARYRSKDQKYAKLEKKKDRRKLMKVLWKWPPLPEGTQAAGGPLPV